MAVYLWKCVAVLCCFTLTTCQQLKLEDIEQDTLTNEKQQDLPLPPQPEPRIAQPVEAQPDSYPSIQIQQGSYQPQQDPYQQQEVSYQPLGTLQQLPPRQYFALPAAQQPQPPQQGQQGPPQASTGPHLFAPGARNFPRPPPLQLQFPSKAPQQQVVSIPVPVYNVQPQPQYPSYPSIQDNSIQDIFNFQPFYSSTMPHYVYVQQPNNNIPVNNKQGSVEYVQYIDPNTNLVNNPKTQAILQNYHHKANHNLAGLIQRTAYTNVLPVNYRQPAPQSYRVQGNPQPLVNQNLYVIPPPQPLQQPTNQIHGIQQQQNQVLAQQRYLVPAQFAPQPMSQLVEPHQAQQSTQTNIVYQKREPQNLLESYVPSALQIEFYKQLEQQNAVQNDGKLTDIFGKN